MSTATPDSMADGVDPEARRPECDPPVPAELRPRNLRQFLGEGAAAVITRGIGMVLDRQSAMASWVADEMAAQPKEYMTSEEAARHMRRSVSWLLRRKDIPYYMGKPNLYKREDLDRWMDENMRHEPTA